MSKAHVRRLAKRSEIITVNLRSGLASANHIVIAVIRNDVNRLPFLLDYYRRLGIQHFIFVDNESNDGSEAFLIEQPDVRFFERKDATARPATAWIGSTTFFRASAAENGFCTSIR